MLVGIHCWRYHAIDSVSCDSYTERVVAIIYRVPLLENNFELDQALTNGLRYDSNMQLCLGCRIFFVVIKFWYAHSLSDIGKTSIK